MTAINTVTYTFSFTFAGLGSPWARNNLFLLMPICGGAPYVARARRGTAIWHNLWERCCGVLRRIFLPFQRGRSGDIAQVLPPC